MVALIIVGIDKGIYDFSRIHPNEKAYNSIYSKY